MQSNQFFDLLKDKYSHERLQILLPALRQDRVIYQGLQETDVLEKISEVFGNEELPLLPGKLVLAAVYPDLANKHYPRVRPQAALLEKWMVGLEAFKQEPTLVSTLPEAVDLALALVEKRKILPSWEKLFQEVLSGRSNSTSFKIWKTSFVICSQITENQDEFISDLQNPDKAGNRSQLWMYCILCNPVTAQEKQQLIFSGIRNFRGKDQVAAIRFLQDYAGLDFSQQVAKDLVDEFSEIETESLKTVEKKNWKSNDLAEIDHQFQRGLISQAASENEIGLKWIQSARGIIERYLAGLKVTEASMLNQMGSTEEAHQIASQIAADEHIGKEISEELILALEDAKFAAGSDETNLGNSPVTELIEAKSIHLAGNSTLAGDTAKAAYGKLMDGHVSPDHIFDQELAMNWSDEKILNYLLSLDSTREACNFVEKILEKDPSNGKILTVAASLFSQNGKDGQALDVLQTLEIVDPENIEIQRSKGLCQEALKDHKAAYKTWSTIINKINQPENCDYLHVAENAVSIGKLDETIDAAQKIALDSKLIGRAQTLIGSAYYSKGNRVLAEQYLGQAIENGTADSAPWMILADIYAQNQDGAKVIETLQAARAAFPESVEISYKLASWLDEQGETSEALGIIAGIAKDHPEHLDGQLLNIKIMKTLHLEGIEEKVQQLAEKFPENPQVMYLLGELLNKKGMRDGAIALLEKANASENAGIELKIALADALIGEDYGNSAARRSPEAITKAKDVLSTISENDHQALVLKAEIALAEGKPEEAYELLTNLDTEQKGIPADWYWRIQAGIARAATATGKIEIALAAIQEAIDDQPGLSGLRKILAEIYQAAGRVNDAVEAASQVLTIAPDVVENVLWFASFLQGLGKNEQAVKVLDEAIKKSPEEKLFPITLAGVYAGENQLEAAGHLLGSGEELAAGLVDIHLLKKAALVYRQIGDDASVEKCLVRRVALAPDDLESVIDLAGFYAALGKSSESIGVLEKLTENSESNNKPALLVCAQKYQDGQYLEAKDGLPVATGSAEFTSVCEFASEYWNSLLQQIHPVEYLDSQISFAMGEFRHAYDCSLQILVDEPKNENVLFIKRMSQRALGSNEKWNWEEKVPMQAGMSSHLALLSAFEFLESNDHVSASTLMDEITKIQDEPVAVKALNAIIAAKQSNVIEAEVAFAESKAGQPSAGIVQKAEDVLQQMCFAAAAEELGHWDSATKSARALWNAQPGNLDLAQQYLRIATRAKENSILCKSLGLKIHILSDEYSHIIENDFAALEKSLNETKDEQRVRWITRAHLVNDPSQTNLKSLALIPPQPDDVVAMMIALHLNSQDHTAVQVAKKFEKVPAVLFALSLCQVEKDPAEALKTISCSVQTEQGQPNAWMLKSMLEEMLGDTLAAVSSCENALSYWPEETSWQTRAASLWTKAGDLHNALSHYEVAAEQEPQNASILLKMGDAYSLLKEHKKAIDTLTGAIELETNNSKLWEALADAYYREGDSEKAMQSAAKASEADPFSIKPYLLTGKVEMERGDLDKSLEQIRTALSKDDKNSEAITFLAKILLRKGEKSQALAALEKAAACEDASIETMVDHANLVREIKGPANSKVIFEKLVKKYPENLDLLRMLIEAQNECGEKAQAEETARMSLKIQPDQPELHHSLGKIKMDNGNLDQAVYHFSQAIALNNEMTDAYIQLAKVYQKQRNSHKALETLQQAIRAIPRDTQIYLAAATILRDAKDYQGAENMLRKAVEIAPDDVNLKRQLGAVIALNLVHNSQQASSHL